jgi:GNAT superfamily N-acetyltransferase
MNAIEVRPITAEETIAVRWPILRPGFPRETAIFDGDDAPHTCHLGSFADGHLCGVASIYLVRLSEQPEVENAWQLRGMATLPEVRGAGAGRALLVACENAARERNAELIWCNARITAAEFYRKHGWKILGNVFEIPTVGPHYRMLRRYRP